MLVTENKLILMKDLIHYIKTTYKKPDNDLMKVIITHFLLFFFLLSLHAFSFLSSIHRSYTILIDNLCLSPHWLKIIHQPWSLLTYSFVKIPTHLGIFSLFGLCFQLFTLSFWGRLLIDFFNSRRFLEVYILTSVLGATAIALKSFYSPFPLTTPPLFGVSTPLYGLMASVATIMPNYIVYIFFSRIKIKYIPLSFLIYSLLSMPYIEYQPQSIANITAMLSGHLYILYLQKGKSIGFTIPTWWRHSFTPPAQPSHNHNKSQITQQKLTSLLDKVAKGGYQSLSAEEKKDLFEA